MLPWSKKRREYREALARAEALSQARRDEEEYRLENPPHDLSELYRPNTNSAANRPASREQYVPPSIAVQDTPDSNQRETPQISGFVSVNRGPSDPGRIPSDAEVIEIPASPSPPTGGPQDNQASSQPNLAPQSNQHASQSSSQSTSEREPHTTFKAIKIHTAKCDVCNNHNKSTLHRCIECGWQICSPCWNVRGSGAHGPTRTFTGPVFRESGGDNSQERPSRSKENDSDDTMSYIEEHARREGSSQGRPPTRGKGKGMTDKDGDSVMSDDAGEGRPPLLSGKRAARQLVALKYSGQRHDAALGPDSDRDEELLLAGNVAYERRRFRDLTPTAETSMNHLLIAAEQVLAPEGPAAQTEAVNSNPIKPAAMRRSPLFVPPEVEPTNSARNPSVDTMTFPRGMSNHQVDSYRLLAQQDPASNLPVDRITPSSPSTDAIETAEANEAVEAMTSISHPGTGFSGGNSTERQTHGSQPSRQVGRTAGNLPTPPDQVESSNGSGGAATVASAPPRRSNRRARAWEL